MEWGIKKSDFYKFFISKMYIDPRKKCTQKSFVQKTDFSSPPPVVFTSASSTRIEAVKVYEIIKGKNIYLELNGLKDVYLLPTSTVLYCMYVFIHLLIYTRIYFCIVM